MYKVQTDTPHLAGTKNTDKQPDRLPSASTQKVAYRAASLFQLREAPEALFVYTEAVHALRSTRYTA